MNLKLLYRYDQPPKMFQESFEPVKKIKNNKNKIKK